MNKKITRVIKSEKLEYFLVSIILLLGLTVRMYKIGTPLADWHSWRQVDTASVTRIYKDYGVNLLYPKYYDISQVQTGYFNPEGYRFVEFPIFNLLHLYAANIFEGKLSFESSGRIVSIIASIISTLSLYIIGKKSFDKWTGLVSALIFAVLPFNIYFSRVVLPEPLAVCFSVVSVALFMYFVDKDKKVFLYTSAIAFSLAMLTKPFSLIYAFPIGYMAIKKFGFRKAITNIPLLLALDIALAPFFLWRAWMGRFLVGIPHFMWAFNGDGIRFRPAFWRWLFAERIGRLMLGMWGLIPFGVGILTKVKKTYTAHMVLIGSVLYLVVIATANVRHDYYQTFIVPAVALMTARGFVLIFQDEKYNRLIRTSMSLFIFAIMLGVSWYEIRGNYNINHFEVIVAGKRADELLPKDARVIAPDNGNTVFLYYTQRFGWPIVNEGIDEMIEKGADYYISVNTNDADTVNFSKKFKTVEKTDRYVILNLHEKI